MIAALEIESGASVSGSWGACAPASEPSPLLSRRRVAAAPYPSWGSDGWAGVRCVRGYYC